MAKKIHNVHGITVKNGDTVLELDTVRLNRNLNNAQFALDSAIMTSMQPFMPMRDGSFISRVKAQNAAVAGTGEVYAAVGPEGRFLYEGNVMVGERSRSAWAKKGERKEKTAKKLQYSQSAHPQAQSHWFDKAKDVDSSKWESIVDKEMAKP